MLASKVEVADGELEALTSGTAFAEERPTAPEKPANPTRDSEHTAAAIEVRNSPRGLDGLSMDMI